MKKECDNEFYRENFMKEIENISAGKIIGIGKLKIFLSEAFPFEIPTLSFLMAKDEKGCFTAICIQLLIQGYGETADAAKRNIKDHVLDYLAELFSASKENAWEQLHELFNDDFSKELWAVYRDMQLNLSEMGINTSLRSAMVDRILELEKQIAELKATIEKNEKQIDVKIVDYKEVA